MGRPAPTARYGVWIFLVNPVWLRYTRSTRIHRIFFF